ncbi:MAG: hypothetical protein M3419_10060 [Actinomycetota bacterium]|nr:hypothetical protein [Actinomycetota bacterium]
MAHPLYLHVGPPRTGTTSVQQLLWANRKNLRAEGICLPGRVRSLQFAAVTELVYGANVPAGEQARDGSWAELTDEILAHDGPGVISHERLAASDEPTITRALDDFAGREVHVIYTIRDMIAITLSGYPGALKRGSALTIDEHVARAVSGVPEERVWNTRAGHALRRWGAVVPPERMHVVTVPSRTAPRTLLWERFCSVIGHDPSSGTMETTRTNESVGVVEADFLNRLNSLAGDDWTPEHQQFVRHVLTPRLLSQREGQRKIQLRDRKARAALTRQTQALADEITERGFHVVGELSDLHVEVDPPQLDPNHDRVTEEEFAELAMSCTRQLVQLVAAERAKTERAKAKNDRQQRLVEALKRAEGRWSPPRVRRLARRIAGRG